MAVNSAHLGIIAITFVLKLILRFERVAGGIFQIANVVSNLMT